MIKKILICNRGEIALRIIRTCKVMGIESVIIYSPEDKNSLCVKRADEHYCIEDEFEVKAYNNIPKILEIAKTSKVDAICTGYGFLSENHLLAEMCSQSGIIFIGPSASSIAMMGDKIEARRILHYNGISVIPGSFEAFQDYRKALEFANTLGYPIILKARNGGGGKGIRLVESPGEMERAFLEAGREVEASFGETEIYVEKVIKNARHIEVQILADKFGNILSLGERECSIQRNYQKVVEESPSIALSNELRKKIQDIAVRAAQVVNYYSAGTVEFLLDEQNRFYFMEMNTRIQVEHPVTEMVTGVDIIKEMINIANDQRLNYIQEDLKIYGHAIEFRICAEDPTHNFTPDYGKIITYKIPEGSNIRFDSGVELGSVMSLSYDNLCAKLIVWGTDRNEAISRARHALDELCISGFSTNIAFHLWLLSNEKFMQGKYSVDFISDEFPPSQSVNEDVLDILLVSAAIGHKNNQRKRENIRESSNWVILNNRHMRYRNW